MPSATTTSSRILLKISGESFGTKESFTLPLLQSISDEIVEASRQNIELGIVMGGGNILRGAVFAEKGISRGVGDDMGMLATVINALLLSELISSKGVKVRIITARYIAGIGELFEQKRCLEYLANQFILLFAGGTGHPYFTTDTAAALRAVEIHASCLLKGTKVDGVYENYSSTNPLQAREIASLTYQKILLERYQVMDLTAVAFCMEHHIPIRVFNLMQPGNLLRAVRGEIGTWIAD
jgi:uridylate kinase